MNEKLKKCPSCNGDIKLMVNPFHIGRNCDCFVRCTKCEKEYPLPNVKLKTWKSNPIRISKTMIRDAEKEWNKMKH